MADLIDRQAAIDIVRHECGEWKGLAKEIVKQFNGLPSAQPTQLNTHNTLEALDCISRQAAIDAVKKNTFRLTFAEEQGCEGHVAWSAEAVYSDVIEGALLELPSAQPEIIRCKDCKWYGRADKRRFYRGMDCLQKHIDTIVPDRDFCSKAERRTDE